MTTEPKKAGRPAKPPGEKYETPGRRLGRVSDEEWETLQRAAESSGKNFTEWAVSILLRAAKRASK
jgi:hypothetical protein